VITITILVLAGVLTAAVGTCLLQVVDAGALLGQEVACVAVDVLGLVGWRRTVGVGIGLDWGVDVSGHVLCFGLKEAYMRLRSQAEFEQRQLRP
jgi:hypothetical protein